MTGLITKAALLSACGMLVAASAMAGVPSATGSTSPAKLLLVSSKLAVPDSITGKFLVTVRDLALNPVVGSNVVVDFSGCSADIRIASNQLNVNYTTNCTGHTVSAYTNAAGQVAFTLLGASSSTFLTHTGAGCARIYADGVLLSSATVGTPDINGSGALSGADIAAWLGDLGSGIYRGRADIDGNGVLSGADIAVWLGDLGRGNSSDIMGVVCP